MNSNKTTIVLLIVIAGLIGFIAYRKHAAAPSVSNGTPAPVQTAPSASGDTADLVSFSIAPGATVSGTKTVTGSIKGAYFFEAQARGMLLDSNKAVVNSFPISATTDWMTSDAVSFTGTFDTAGVPSGSGFIRIANDNASGDPAHDKFVDIPVVFQ